jgi:hypothetical protein
MNYLVTHYKNLAEQLQARINNIQQCLYEMDTGSYSSGSRKDMGPVNPPTHGGGLLPPQNPNRRPESAGRSAPKNPGHGGGFYDRPINRVDGRQTLQSTGDSERPSNQYDQNHPFWSSQRGSLFLQNWALLAAALRMPTLDRATMNAINQQGFQTLAAFRAHLQNLANTYANQYGVVMPPLGL